MSGTEEAMAKVEEVVATEYPTLTEREQAFEKASLDFMRAVTGDIKAIQESVAHKAEVE